MRYCILFFFIIALGCEQRTESPTRGRMEVMATESLAPLIQREAEEFHRLYPEADVSVFPASTREAIVHMLNDSIRLIITDRPLNDEERAIAKQYEVSFVETKIAQDALAVIVHTRNPMETVTLASLETILNGSALSWNRIPESHGTGRIELALTARNSGVYELLMNHFFHLNAPIVPNFISETQVGVFEYVASHPRAIGVISIAALNDTTREPRLRGFRASTRVLAVAGADSAGAKNFVKLHQANVYRKKYPLHYPVYLYTTAASMNVAAGFSAFIASVPGQKIFLNAGLVPATMPVRLVQTTQEQLSQ